MKKFAIWSTMILIALSLTACAATTTDGMKVKCPACGAEFEIGGEQNY